MLLDVIGALDEMSYDERNEYSHDYKSEKGIIEMKKHKQREKTKKRKAVETRGLRIRTLITTTINTCMMSRPRSWIVRR